MKTTKNIAVAAFVINLILGTSFTFPNIASLFYEVWRGLIPISEIPTGTFLFDGASVVFTIASFIIFNFLEKKIRGEKEIGKGLRAILFIIVTIALLAPVAYFIYSLSFL